MIILMNLHDRILYEAVGLLVTFHGILSLGFCLAILSKSVSECNVPWLFVWRVRATCASARRFLTIIAILTL